MQKLTSTQRKKLRGLSHGLPVIVRLGKAGLTEAVQTQVVEALERHELVKVRIDAEREDRPGMAEQIARDAGAAVAGLVGKVAILYRPHPDPERRRIELPG